MKQKLIEARENILEAVKFIKTQSTAYLDYSGRRMVDSAITVICGHLFLGPGGQVRSQEGRGQAIHRERGWPKCRPTLAIVNSGDITPMNQYQLLAGPVPSAG